MATAAKLPYIWPLPGPDTVARLLDWYDRERRDLPWRAPPGRRMEPYRVWLSEIMLQQTTVKSAIPYYQRFVARWPEVAALAAAGIDDVLAEWSGLGYYSRARNLHACARIVLEEHGGLFPSTEKGLRALPGIGEYTAAAIAAIAFGRATTPVDGNIERVVARLFAVREPIPSSRKALRQRARSLTPRRRAGDFAQAMMDLGALVCTPRRPSCLVCPVGASCAARAMAIEESLPARVPRRPRRRRFGVAFVALREDGHVLLRQRPETGLLARMMEVPSTEWQEGEPTHDEAMRQAPVHAAWWRMPGAVRHVFTHLELELAVCLAVVGGDATINLWADPERCRWVHRHRLGAAALPSVMRKVLDHALSGREASAGDRQPAKPRRQPRQPVRRVGIAAAQ